MIAEDDMISSIIDGSALPDYNDDIDDDLVQLLKEKYLIKEEEPSLDDILEKIHQKGVSSLTIQEKAILNNYN